MQSRKNLEAMKHVLSYNLGQVESDYLQHIILLSLTRHTGSWLVIKGGTALQKAYGLNRFSDDLDFTSKKEKGLEELSLKIQRDLHSFGLENEIEVKKVEHVSQAFIYRIKGPLYDGSSKSAAVQRMEISLREKVIMKAEVREVVPLYPDLQPYLLNLMNLEEILAEKIRAIITRNKARDVYDAWFLIRKNVALNLEVINKKLEYYNLSFDRNTFKAALSNNKRIWKTELKPLVSFVPDFEKVEREISDAFNI